MLKITGKINIPLDEIECQAVRSQGAGGQKVNKVATAIHLRFQIHSSSLPDDLKERLLHLPDRRISKDGVIIIKAQQYRSQAKNKEAAMMRLQKLIRSIAASPKTRKATKPTIASYEKRLVHKKKRAQVKLLRKKVCE